MLASLVRKILFQLPPETAHCYGLRLAALAHSLGVSITGERVSKPVSIAGMTFPNPVGLAAGYDKNGEYVDALSALGFGFIEVGTVTPRAQPGNPAPRMFRIPQAEALINRMGFNNKGVEHLVNSVRSRRFSGPVGINIGKNAATPPEKAVDDYTEGLTAVYSVADYVTVNISSPNTQGLRNLQTREALEPLLTALSRKREELRAQSSGYVPIFVKIAPDCSDAEFKDIARLIPDCGMDGVIATNTTLDRRGVEGMTHSDEKGGLSGAPLAARAVEVVTLLRELLPAAFPLIASGGVTSVEQALRLKHAGADAVQVYTGLVYRGPGIVSDIARAW